MWGKPWDVPCGVSYEVCHVGHVGQVGSAIATTCPSGIYRINPFTQVESPSFITTRVIQIGVPMWDLTSTIRTCPSGIYRINPFTQAESPSYITTRVIQIGVPCGILHQPLGRAFLVSTGSTRLPKWNRQALLQLGSSKWASTCEILHQPLGHVVRVNHGMYFVGNNLTSMLLTQCPTYKYISLLHSIKQ